TLIAMDEDCFLDFEYSDDDSTSYIAETLTEASIASDGLASEYDIELQSFTFDCVGFKNAHIIANANDEEICEEITLEDINCHMARERDDDDFSIVSEMSEGSKYSIEDMRDGTSLTPCVLLDVINGCIQHCSVRSKK
ncbi:6444_t:CDS:1, partial [Paraglomus brasilianum]